MSGSELAAEIELTAEIAEVFPSSEAARRDSANEKVAPLGKLGQPKSARTSKPNLRLAEADKNRIQIVQNWYDPIQRGLDIVGAVIGLILSAPLLVMVALIIRLTSKGPVLLRQRRLTQGGRPFNLYKFRSMRHDAEKMSGAVFAKNRDPRITRFGHFIRRTRLDELPQLWNVLVGDMSIIGPRPERPELAVELRRRYRSFDRRLAVKAGLTGLGQVLGGYAGSMSEYKKKLAYDRLYVQRRSPWLDAKILMHTVRVVVSMSGAR